MPSTNPPSRPMLLPPPDDRAVLRHTRAWLERAVIGLGLCPFAKGVHARRQIRWVVSPARTRQAPALERVSGFRRLADADPRREGSVQQAVASFPDAASIFERSIATPHSLGWPGRRQLAEDWK